MHGRLYAFLLRFGNFSRANSLLNFGGCNCLSLGVTYQKKDPPAAVTPKEISISLFGGARLTKTNSKFAPENGCLEDDPFLFFRF